MLGLGLGTHLGSPEARKYHVPRLELLCMQAVEVKVSIGKLGWDWNQKFLNFQYLPFLHPFRAPGPQKSPKS